MRQLDIFKCVERSTYKIFCDTGPHFRNAEFLHYLFNELAGQKIKVSLNFFCEAHGKNSRYSLVCLMGLKVFEILEF